MISPALPARSGAVLYVHGGGYCCGDLEYAKGFGTILASEANARVFCPAYRLAPEYPYPAALNDVMTCYRYLIKTFPPEKIVLAGEFRRRRSHLQHVSADKGRGASSPRWSCGHVALDRPHRLRCILQENAEIDPSMTLFRLQRFANVYTDTPADPLCSPVFGDLSGLPESLLSWAGTKLCATMP